MVDTPAGLNQFENSSCFQEFIRKLGAILITANNVKSWNFVWQRKELKYIFTNIDLFIYIWMMMDISETNSIKAFIKRIGDAIGNVLWSWSSDEYSIRLWRTIHFILFKKFYEKARIKIIISFALPSTIRRKIGNETKGRPISLKEDGRS